jgi:hypothetical protein
MQANNSFKEKIECLYQKVANKNIHILAQLFLGNTKTSLENRALHIRNIWLKKENFTPRLFKKEFHNYQISKIKVNNNLLFQNAEEFLELDIKEFCKKIDLYLYKEHKFNFDEEVGYKYFYVYHANNQKSPYNLSYYTLEYNSLGPLLNTINITLYPPSSRTNILPYKGSLVLEKNKIILDVQNNIDHIFAIFNTETKNDTIDYLVGVAIGISDFNQKTPIAKKVVFSKKKFKDLAKLYLILNETEIISATEGLSYLSSLAGIEKEEIQFHKLHYKIKNINTFLQNASKEFYKSFYKQVAFREFNRTNEIFLQVINNNSYYITCREMMLKVLLESYEYEQYDSLYIVMPIDTKYGIFNHFSQTIEFIKEKLIELSSKIKIEFIFTLKDYNYQLCHIQDFLDKLSKNAKIYFVLNSNIEKEVNSIDFVFTKNKNFVLTKELRSLKNAHKFYLSKLSHQEYENFYEKIKKYSIEYEKFLNNPTSIKFEKIDDITQKLLGKWHLYLFGTNQKFWKLTIIFKKDKTIEIYHNNILENTGIMVHKNIQTVIIADNIHTKRTTVATFDNHFYNIKEAFLVSILSKSLYSEADIYTLGICSRNEITDKDIKDILLNGEISSSKEYEEVKKRLTHYLRNKS